MKTSPFSLLLPIGLLASVAAGCTAKKVVDAGAKQAEPKAASAVLGENNMSPEAQKFVSDAVNIKTKYGVLKLAAEKRAEIGPDVGGTPAFQGKPDDYRLYSTLVAPLVVTRSLVYRMQTIFQRAQGVGDKNDPVHSMFLTVVRNAASALPLTAPTSQWRAGFSYFTEPLAPTPEVIERESLAQALQGVEPIADNAQFKSVDEAQQFVCREVLPEADLLQKRLEAFRFTKPAEGLDQEIVFDLKGALGSVRANPEDPASERANDKDIAPLDRFLIVRPHDVKLMAAAAAMGAHNLRVFCAYEQNGVLEWLEALGKFVAMDRGVVLVSEVEGLTAKQRKDILDSVNPRFLTLRGDGRTLLAAALADLQKAVKLTNEAWPSVKKDNEAHPHRTFFFPNPLSVSPFDRWTDQNLEALNRLVTSPGPTTLQSNVTNESVQVDFQKFYLDPQNDVRAFMPVAFESGKENLYRSEAVSVGGATREVKFKNYFFGRPTAWNGAVWSKYFPGLPSTAAGADARPALRVLGSSWAGWVVAGPLAGFAM